MRTWACLLLFTALASAGCGRHYNLSGPSQPRTPEQAAAIEGGVRAFMRTVAHDVTQEGPAAWTKYFADSPSFFMAVNGRIEFPNSAAATAAIPDIARSIKLAWGDDLRVDRIAPNFAVVAASYYEERTDSSGQSVEEFGFFTGTAEFRSGRWQFRNLHWSVTVAPHATH